MMQAEVRSSGRERGAVRVVAIWIAILAIVVSLAAWGFARLGVWLAAPASAPTKADAIVSLGGDPGGRVILAGRLYEAAWARNILLTGVKGPPAAHHRHLDWRVEVLEDAGVPRDAMFFDSRSSSSWYEALNTRQLMERMGWRKVLVVSDPPHMRRLQWTWRRAFEGTGLEFTLVAAPDHWWHPKRWWRSESSRTYVLREVGKLLYYVLTKPEGPIVVDGEP
jgi:uncharacterized SAM-binding protein YcdF (DUF218 family)